MKCELCDNKANRSSIINDIYYRAICMTCYAFLMSGEVISSGQAEYNRNRDVEEHEADMIQPWNGDGKPSQEFIHLYPEKAKQMFSDEELNQATRK
jgi:hypothetical protein